MCCLLLLLLCSHSPNDVPPEPQQNVSISAVRGAVRPSKCAAYESNLRLNIVCPHGNYTTVQLGYCDSDVTVCLLFWNMPIIQDRDVKFPYKAIYILFTSI